MCGHTSRLLRCGILLTCAVLIGGTKICVGQPQADEDDQPPRVQPVERIPLEATDATASDTPRKRWLLVCCGLPGDAEHRERLTGACRNIISAAEPVFGVDNNRLRILAGDEEMQTALAADALRTGICTKDSVQQILTELSEAVSQDDGCWIILLGHAHLRGSQSQFNVLDQDFDQNQFGEWASELNCREQVFLLTFPVSGFWLRPLRAPNRVVISATEPDLEFTGTELPYALADVVARKGAHAKLEDIDRDGSVSLLDLYLASTLEVHGRFKALERLQTEHAQLDDNGDGRGSELQIPYLPEDQDEEQDTEDEQPAVENREPPRIVTNPNLDGYRSRHVILNALKPRTE